MGMGLWMLVWTTIVLIVIAFAFGATTWLFPSSPRSSSPNAHDILDARYAQGELTPDEYHRMRRDLGRPVRWAGLALGTVVGLLILLMLGLASLATRWGMHGPLRPGGWSP
ncbi:MAG TPA: SHOCT domain-containing protein [bacterium]|nr:SHOCT domain-containing protein [bacterium]